ncbi:MAG: hypothetical protein AAGL66_12575, partial [Pseudomonadota bacterium]
MDNLTAHIQFLKKKPPFAVGAGIVCETLVHRASVTAAMRRADAFAFGGPGTLEERASMRAPRFLGARFQGAYRRTLCRYCVHLGHELAGDKVSAWPR